MAYYPPAGGYPTGQIPPPGHPPSAPAWTQPPVPAGPWNPPPGAPPAVAAPAGFPPAGMGGGNPPPVYSPQLPFVGPVGSVFDGFMIKVNGTVQHNTNRFHINLATGPHTNERGDIPLHVNPRFEGGNQIVRNSFMQGRWGQEERAGPPMPLKQGHAFEIIILTTNSEFRIAVNGQHFCEFRHRSAKESITHVVIEGNVQISSVAYEGQRPAGGAPPPSWQPPAGQFPPPAHCPQPPSWGNPNPPPYAPPGGGCAPPPNQAPSHFPMPYKIMMNGGLHQNKMIRISGTPKPGNPDRFAVNLLVSNQRNADNAFHFNPRFREKVVVRNTLQRSWGREERQAPHFPFSPGVPFTMIILIEQHQIKVAVNNTHFIEYRHRITNLASINFLEIEGDVVLSNVQA